MQPARFKAGDYPYDVEEELKSISIVSTLDELDELLEYLDELAERGIISALDTETTGVNPKKEAPAGKGRIVTAQIAWIEEADEMGLKELVDAIIDKKVQPTRVWIDCRDPAMIAKLGTWCARKDAPKCLQGASFDKHQFWNHGIIVEGIEACTLQMSREEYPERMSHSLDGELGLVRQLLGDKRLTTLQALGTYKKKKDGTDGKSVQFTDMLVCVDDDEMRPFQQVYSTFDVDDTVRVYYVLRERMEEMEWEGHEDGFWAYWEGHGKALCEVLIRMERQGVCVDEEVVDELLETYKKREDGLLEQIYAILGAPVNLDSSPQKAFSLYGSGTKVTKRPKKHGGDFVIHGLGLPCKEVDEYGEDPWEKKRNKAGRWVDGNPSTDKEHLEWTLGRIDPDADEADLLRLLRDRGEINKLISGTLEPMKRNLRPRHRSGVREPKEGYMYLHGNFAPVARTGRLSSSLPNLQQVPSRTYLGKRIRHAFGCEPGQSLLVADYSQLELNILSWYLAALFGDLSYAKLLRSGDIHSLTAQTLGIKRYAAKAINFGILYGMSEFNLAIRLGISVPAARDILHQYYDEYPYVEQYGSWAIKYAKEHGTSRTMMGRYRQLPHINEAFRGGRRAGCPTSRARADERRAKNSPIQGSAHDIVAEAMIAIDEDEELKDYGYAMNLQVHDELVGACKSKYRKKALARKVYIMENAVTFPEYEGHVIFPVEGHAGLTWGEGKTGSPFTCKWCKGRGKKLDDSGYDCPTCEGEGEFNLKRSGDIWIAEAA